jgi:hypothetical protein
VFFEQATCSIKIFKRNDIHQKDTNHVIAQW